MASKVINLKTKEVRRHTSVSSPVYEMLMAMDQDRVKRRTLALMALSARVLLPRGYLHSHMCSVSAPHLKERGPMVAQHVAWRMSTFFRLWGSHSPAVKSSVLWNTSPFTPLKINRRFGGTCCLPKDKPNKHIVQTGSGANQMGTGGLFPRGWPGCEANQLPPSRAEVKKTWVYISTPPYAFMV
jgi:hypothetical protein